ncbi:MAG: sn-glycerol-3-phosphate ABC transporter ATP-binding protein UgpC [Acidobacteriota bacterium]
MAEVSLKKVKKSYGDNTVIQKLDLDIRDQEFMVLVGPSGCGKSTALRMIAGLEEITGGDIEISGRVVNDLAPKDRDIAMVFQSYALYPHMTVRENMAFGLRIRKMSNQEIDQRVEEAAKILDITHLLERKPKALSGGQRQRVAVGRAIVRHPSVFLFDEPLSNLDAKLRVQMRAEISKLQKRLKTTTVYVTHDQVEAMTMGDRIAILRDGDLQQVGTPLDIYREPANTFVATFIGTPPMNLLDAEVKEGRVFGHGFDLPLPDELAKKTTGGGHKLVIGLRPEHLRVDDETPDNAAPVHLEVEVVEPLGHETLVHGRIADGPLITAIAPPHFAAGAGAKVELSARVHEMHLFDAGTQDRL